MGVSAARTVGAVPRALGNAVVAVDRQRSPVDTRVGTVQFVTRTIERLDVRRVDTDLATGWATTPEQTVLDLADRPALGDLSRTDVLEAITALADQIDWDLIGVLAREQRKSPAAVRAAWLCGAPPLPRLNRLVDPLGFRPRADHPPADYGIRPC